MDGIRKGAINLSSQSHIPAEKLRVIPIELLTNSTSQGKANKKRRRALGPKKTKKSKPLKKKKRIGKKKTTEWRQTVKKEN
jgi:hypothetical protein